MLSYMFTGQGENFKVWMYPTARTAVRHYPEHETEVSSELFYVKYQVNSMIKCIGRAHTRAWIEEWLCSIGHAPSSLKWRVTPCNLLERQPWHVPAGKSGIYFVVAEGSNFIKIGFAKDVNSRLAALRTGCPYPVRILALLDGTIEDEHNYHRRFSQYHTHNEWFRLEGDLLTFVSQLPIQTDN